MLPINLVTVLIDHLDNLWKQRAVVNMVNSPVLKHLQSNTQNQLLEYFCISGRHGPHQKYIYSSPRSNLISCSKQELDVTAFRASRHQKNKEITTILHVHTVWKPLLLWNW